MLLVLFLTILSTVLSVLTVKNQKLVDEFGRQRIYHGLNVVMKSPPYIPDLTSFSLDTSFSETDMENLREWGINSIRLGVMWAGVEPKRGQYNQTYLDLMRSLVDTAEKYNISVLVQFHQDLFSEKFCGDGVPMWAIPKKVSALFPLPLSMPYKYDQQGVAIGCGKHPWGAYYSTISVNRGFHMLYNDQTLLTSFTNYWGKVAEAFATSNNVIAYELINQPWPGNLYRLPLVMVPYLSESINLQRVYDRLSQTIRKIDPNNPICFEPVTWLNVIPAGFKHPPGGKQHANKSILCYHYYNPPTFNMKGFFETRLSDLKRLKVGGIMSEMYVIGEEGKRNQPAMDLMDTQEQSWLGWLYKSFSKGSKSLFFYNADGSTKQQGVKVISRTYAQAVAGTTLSHSFNRTTGEFLLKYELCTTCGETVVYFNRKMTYADGYKVIVQPADAVDCQVEGNYIRVKPNKYSGENQYTIVRLVASKSPQ